MINAHVNKVDMYKWPLSTQINPILFYNAFKYLKKACFVAFSNITDCNNR